MIMIMIMIICIGFIRFLKTSTSILAAILCNYFFSVASKWRVENRILCVKEHQKRN